jgi:hypothetical protein
MVWRSSRVAVIAAFTAVIWVAVETLTPIERTPLELDPVK